MLKVETQAKNVETSLPNDAAPFIVNDL